MLEKKNTIANEFLRKPSEFSDLLKKDDNNNIEDFINSEFDFI
jgi:hypothetical protein